MARESDDLVQLRRALGRQLATFRKAANLSQTDLGGKTSYHRTTIAHVEAGKARADARFWKTADELTGADGALIAGFTKLQEAKHQYEAQSRVSELADAQARAEVYRQRTKDPHDAHTPAEGLTVTVAGDGHVDSEDEVKRAEFLAGLVSAVSAPAILFGESRRLGMDDARRYRASLEQLYALDDSFGSTSEVFALTVRTLRKLRRDFDRASYSPAVGQQTRVIAGQLMEHASWLAFDAGRESTARHWWLEALHAARMADEGQDVEIVVLASMSANASKQGRGREAVDLAATAQRVPKSKTSPRLMSLLLAREALGHARCGDTRSAAQALERAQSKFDQAPAGGDPFWLDFWDAADLTGHEAATAWYLHDLNRAETSARDALARVNAATYPRVHTFSVARLAHVLAEQGKLDEALPLTAQAALSVADFNSHRVNCEIAATLGALAPHKRDPEVHQLIESVTPLLPIPGNA